MSFARRDFLKTAVGLSLPGTLGAWQIAATDTAGPAPDTAFGFADDRVPMNAANLCPMPTAISEAVARFSASLDKDLSSANRSRIEGMKENARAGIAALLGTQADEIAIVRNASEANSIIVQGVELGEGDEVLLWDQNHPSNAVAWDVRAARDRFTVRRFTVPMDATSVDQVVEHIARQPGPRTRLISFTHISNTTGFALPAAAICAALRRHSNELFIHVDGAQTWGVCDVDLAAMGCDSFSASAHKWFMGPRETGMLYINTDRQQDVAAAVVSIPWGSEIEPSVAGARRFEALGQRDDAAIAALAETVAWHGALTPAGVAARARAISARLRGALMDLDVPFVSRFHADFHSNVIILQAAGENQRVLPERIFEASGIITASTGGLRMSPHIYNTPDHVNRVASAVAASRHLLGTR